MQMFAFSPSLAASMGRRKKRKAYSSASLGRDPTAAIRAGRMEKAAEKGLLY